MKQYGAGLQGERQAEEYLCSKGMTVVERRYRGQDGEVDLIMQDGDVVVFVEVKARPHGRSGDGLLAVTYAKQRRLTHAALAFLVEREWTNRPVRFDVVEITAQGLLHVPNAFMAIRS
ncbi:MAG: YraN family protein [Clostridia bacterium]|nr:YraN family protein [Clostridia bacterium]